MLSQANTGLTQKRFKAATSPTHKYRKVGDRQSATEWQSRIKNMNANTLQGMVQLYGQKITKDKKQM